MSIRLELSEIHIDVQRNLNNVRADHFWTYAATEWHRLYSPFVPFQEGALQNTVVISPGQIEHAVPYARYQYHGEAYGPNYPIYQNGVIVGYYSQPGMPKHPIGKELQYKRDQHPLASKEWDKAAEPTQKPKLVKALQKYVDSGRLGFDD